MITVGTDSVSSATDSIHTSISSEKNEDEINEDTTRSQSQNKESIKLPYKLSGSQLNLKNTLLERSSSQKSDNFDYR